MYNAVCNVVCTKVNAVCIDCFKFMMNLCINLWCFFWKVWWLIQGCCHFHTEIHCASATLHGSCWQLHMFSKLLTWYFLKNLWPHKLQDPENKQRWTMIFFLIFSTLTPNSGHGSWSDSMLQTLEVCLGSCSGTRRSVHEPWIKNRNRNGNIHMTT